MFTFPSVLGSSLPAVLIHYHRSFTIPQKGNMSNRCGALVLSIHDLCTAVLFSQALNFNRFKAPPSLSYRDRLQGANTPPYSGRSSPFTIDNNFSSSSTSLPAHYNTANNSAGRFQSQRTAEELESQNDERLDGLSAKVKLLKDVREL